MDTVNDFGRLVGPLKYMVGRLGDYFEALAERTKAETEAIKMGLGVGGTSEPTMEQAINEILNQSPPKGPRFPWGFCPTCGGPGVHRDRDGVDRCENGHIYPSTEATKFPKTVDLSEEKKG